MKKSYLLLSLVFLMACQSKVENNSNKTIIVTYFNHFNKHDWKAMADLYVDTAEMKDPSIGIDNVKMSKTDIISKYTELEKMIPDVKDSIVNMYFAGNNITVEFISTGTAPDGSKFHLPICTVFEIKEGKISKDLTYYDN